MNSYLAVGIAEGFEEPEDEAQIVEAWQFIIDTGLWTTLQGWFGRTCAALIEDGVCEPPSTPELNFNDNTGENENAG